MSKLANQLMAIAALQVAAEKCAMYEVPINEAHLEIDQAYQETEGKWDGGSGSGQGDTTG